jgi:hypothetical protein
MLDATSPRPPTKLLSILERTHRRVVVCGSSPSTAAQCLNHRPRLKLNSLSKFWERWPVWRIRDVYPRSRIRLFSNPDPGSEQSPSPIPDPHQKFKYPHPDPHQKKIRTRIRINRFVCRIKNILQDLKILLKNIKFLLCSSRIRILSSEKSDQDRDRDPNNRVISRIRIRFNMMRIHKHRCEVLLAA